MMSAHAKRLVSVAVISLISIGFAANALACSTAAWAGGVSGGTAGSPPTLSRYSEFCAFEVTSQAHVQSNFASDARYRVRFYVFDGLTGSGNVDVFEAYGNEAPSGPLFKVSFNGSQFTIDATGAGGASATAAAKGGWNVIEMDWTSGGQLKYWINSDATPDTGETGSVNAGSGTVEAVRLGAPNGFASQTGKLIFDAFESHRTTPIGLLKAGDANNDNNVNSGDIIAVINEFFDSTKLGAGQPDCNGDGNVNSGDIICVINTFFGA